MSIDGVWCAIGSSNFDDRSFEINDEITLGMMDAPLAREFEAIFERDRKDCIELELKSWRSASYPRDAQLELGGAAGAARRLVGEATVTSGSPPPTEGGLAKSGR